MVRSMACMHDSSREGSNKSKRSAIMVLVVFAGQSTCTIALPAIIFNVIFFVPGRFVRVIRLFIHVDIITAQCGAR